MARKPQTPKPLAYRAALKANTALRTGVEGTAFMAKLLARSAKHAVLGAKSEVQSTLANVRDGSKAAWK